MSKIYQKDLIKRFGPNAAGKRFDQKCLPKRVGQKIGRKLEQNNCTLFIQKRWSKDWVSTIYQKDLIKRFGPQAADKRFDQNIWSKTNWSKDLAKT